MLLYLRILSYQATFQAQRSSCKHTSYTRQRLGRRKEALLKFLGGNVREDLTWSQNTEQLVKEVQQ